MRAQPFHVTSPAPREVWQRVFEADANAMMYQSPVWLDCICALGSYEDASRLYELPGGRQLVLPLVRRKGFPAALATQASLPFSWGMGGLVASDTVQAEDVAAVFADLADQPALRTCIRPNPLAADAWAAARPRGAISIPRLAHILDLEGGFDRVWSEQFKSATRTAVRKAERAGLVVECDTTGRLIPVFYALLRRSIDRWARQQHEPLPLARWRGRRRDPLRKFQIMARALGAVCRVWVAWHDGQPVAAIIVLLGNNANYSRGVMNKDLAGSTQANVLLQKLAIEDACRAGCRYYHMGESGLSASLAQFKKRFGARAYPYAEYRLERLPVTAVDNRLRGFIKKVIGFKDV